jgi:hypothetical protein
MGPVSGAARVTAAAVAVSVTLSLVWSIAALAYPAQLEAPTRLVAASSVCAQ